MGTNYDDIMNRMAADRALTALSASPPAPDAAGKANVLARQTGVPADTADRNLQLLSQQAQVARARQLFDRYPTMATWAGNPRNAAVGQDDMDHLAKNAQYWQDVGKAAGSITATPDASTSLWGALKGIGTDFVESGKQTINALHQQFADFFPGVGAPTPAKGIPSLGSNPDYNMLYQRSQARQDAADPQYKSWYARGLYGGASSLAQMLPSVIAGVVAGPEAGLALGAVQQGQPAYSKYRSRGASPKVALLGGGLEGAAEAAGEKLPLGFLVDKMGKVGAKEFISGFVGRELPSEVATTLAQNAVDTAIANPDKTWGQFAAEQPDAIVQTAIGTLVAGGFFGGINHIAQRHAQAIETAATANAASSLDTAMTAAAESKTRARDPEAFRQFVDLHTTGSPIENVFVPAEKLATYFQSMGVDYHSDAFWGNYSDQIDEGQHTGGDVVVPTADAAAHLAGTPTWDHIRPDVRTSPGGVSIAESEALAKSSDKGMEEVGAQVAEDLATSKEADAPRQKVYQDIRDKLTNAGYTQDAAHTNAELVAQRYATRAERLGRPLTGDETKAIEINSVLPDKLGAVLAADPGKVALKTLIATMRKARGGKVPGVPTLLEWISKQGGIVDRGGDVAAMGGETWHVGKPGKRKLIRAAANLNQGDMLGGSEQQNANTPDELAARAQEAGYFAPGDRPTVNDLLDAIGQELRGQPVEIQGHGGGDPQAAADELAQILDQSGLDPAKATDSEIERALEQYRQAASGGMQQTFADGPRGQISFTQGKSIIDLFQSRNMSTLAHEMGHQWLEELRADALGPDASDQIKADWQAVQDWFKANGHGLKDGVIPVDAHELWARGTERFLMEGKSPSTALRRVFDAFKAWMLQIYKVVDNLNAPITPEIRDVMQRLIATDDEIATADEKQSLATLFNSAADAALGGMSEAEYNAYKATSVEAKGEAHDALLYRTMAAIRKERTKAWKDEEAGVRSDISERVNRRPEFKALHLLRTGKMLDDREFAQMRVKLDRDALVAEYGDGIIGLLPKSVPPIYAETGAMHADDIAELVGFRTGDEMVRTLVTLEERKRELVANSDKRSVRQALIDEETHAEMLDRHGDVLNDGSIEEEALAAVHNDKQGEVIAAELRSLGRRSNRHPTPYSLAKEWARTKIAESTVQEATSGSSIQRYARAAAKAGREAEKAMLAGDIDETYRQKQAQMLNSALVAEAGRVRDLVTAARDRLASYAKRRTIKSMDQDYLEQIHGLLEQVDLKTRSQADVERQQSFEEWAKGREAEGHDVVVPSSFGAMLGTTHWSRLTTERLLALDDTVKQIAHLGRFKQQLLDGQEQREFEAVRDEALSGIDQLPPKPPKGLDDPSWSDRLKSGIASVDASLLKMETVFDWLDGGNSQGVFNRVVFKPIADAQTRESDMLADYYGRIRTSMEQVPGEDIKRWMDRVTLPELIDKETGQAAVLQRQRLIALALNMGNEGNTQRVTDGHGWSREAVMTVLNRELSPADWQFVQRTWDTIDTLWPEIAAMERRVNGVEPEKVVAVPLETKHGTLRGGYYPAIYDTSRDLQAERNAGSGADLLETTYTKATTRASSTKDRVQKVKRPILLQLGVINRHLGEVIHDITHREVVMNADKFLSDSRIATGINRTLGPEVRKQLRPWLKSVANQWANDRAGLEGFAGFVTKARANTTAVGMGFRLSTIVSQIGGYSNSFENVGPQWVAPAMAKSAAHPVETYRFVMERSGEIRHRMDNLDRDINAGLKTLAGQHDIAADAKRFLYHGIGYTDRMVVVPTWIGAYNKALAGGADEAAAVYEADKAVRQSQGSGAAKDLAAIQRGMGSAGALAKITTMFYSYMSAFYQRQRTFGRDTGAAIRERNTQALPGLMARAWWLFVLPPVLNELLADRGPDDDEDWGTWVFKQMLFQQLGPIPIVRDLAKPIWDGVAGNRSFGYQISPLQRAGDTIVNLGKDVGRKARGEETKQMTRDALETAGYATGIVPGQVASATQFLVDVGHGDQDPQSAGDWYRGLTTGKAEAKR